ncbi:equilibrative nucleobase transporter 1 isoform X4 [Columba livia]|uniref:equilibrative nucleobase transporter 1 isoform X4 n=1 Tax=Columba livia TaxID=8932 RepID=UPI0031BA334A
MGEARGGPRRGTRVCSAGVPPCTPWQGPDSVAAAVTVTGRAWPRAGTAGTPLAGDMAQGGAGVAKRLGTLLSGLLECGGFCGIIFGWASLVFVLKDLGYFQELCQPSTNLTELPGCSRQDEEFSLVFTIGSFMNNFMTFPTGFIFDRFGTTIARLVAISLYTGGTLLVAFSTPALAVLLFPAMSMLSVGGMLLILTNTQVGNLFGKYRSIIITLYNGAFDSSSAVFLIVKVLYERGLSLRTMFLFMAACSAWHLLRTLFLMPRSRIPYPLPPAYDYGLRCPGRSQSYRTYEEKRPPEETGPEETPLEPSAPTGALGTLADLRASVLSLVVTVTQCVLFSICAAVPVLPVQFGTFVLQVLSRSFLYGGNAAFLAIAFPPQHFGKLYGLAMALSALVALLQYPCVTLVRGPLDGDPFYVNVGLIAVVLVAFVSPVVVARKCRQLAKDLGAAGTPLTAPPSAETPTELPH